MSETYTVTVMAETLRALRVKVEGLGITPWLPKSRVAIPDGVKRGDRLELEIPNWIIRSEIGEPD